MPRKRCIVAFARRDRQFHWHVELPFEATIAEAIAAARAMAPLEDIPWDSSEVGVFGERRSRDARVEEGDRVELYRPLPDDPRERRRRRARYVPGSG
jgi:putative ubiquitin-RnfH superfamily antitoxin RatB of RatAB toxin-antitoxin module